MSVRIRLVHVAVVLSLVTTSHAAAQEVDLSTCGSISTGIHAYQNGEYLAVIARSWTTRELSTICALNVQAEVWIGGIGGANTARAHFAAQAVQAQAVPRAGRYQAHGKHWIIAGFWPHERWIEWPQTYAEADVVAPPTGGGGGGSGCNGRDCAPDTIWDPQLCQCVRDISPILIDTAFDGYKLTSLDRGVRFDLDADGTPEQCAWTRPDSDDAWLAMDRNGNGVIDNGGELFGNYTLAYPDIADSRAANGFEALSFTENPVYGVSLSDDQIDARDAVFSRLLLWRDANHNGLSEPEELTPAADFGLQAISTDYKLSRRADRHGNEFRQRAKSTWRAENGTLFTHPVFDVWLLVDSGTR